MSLTIPKPVISILSKPMTPPWVLAVVIVSQIAFTQIGKESSPVCILKFERLHYSTSVKRNLGLDAIKMNIKSICTVPQRRTELTATIEVLAKGNPKNYFTSPLTVARSDYKKPNDAEFLDFWAECKKGETLILSGEASGRVYLEDGREIPISNRTGKFSPVFCNFTAK